MPPELENLLAIARIKYLAKQKKISKIVSKTGNKGKSKTAVVFTFEPNKIEINIEELVKKYGNKIKFSAGIKPMVTLEVGTSNERQILKDIIAFLG